MTYMDEEDFISDALEVVVRVRVEHLPVLAPAFQSPPAHGRLIQPRAVSHRIASLETSSSRELQQVLLVTAVDLVHELLVLHRVLAKDGLETGRLATNEAKVGDKVDTKVKRTTRLESCVFDVVVPVVEDCVEHGTNVVGPLLIVDIRNTNASTTNELSKLREGVFSDIAMNFAILALGDQSSLCS